MDVYFALDSVDLLRKSLPLARSYNMAYLAHFVRQNFALQNFINIDIIIYVADQFKME